MKFQKQISKNFKNKFQKISKTNFKKFHKQTRIDANLDRIFFLAQIEEKLEISVKILEILVRN